MRAPTTADLDAVYELGRACDITLTGEPDIPRALIEDDWARPRVELERDARVVLHRDRTIVGYVIAEAIDPASQFEMFGMVHPEHAGNGIGGALNEWAERTAAARVPRSVATSIKQSADSNDEAAKRLFEGRGFAYARTFWHMQRELANGLENAEPPPGIVVHVAPEGAKDPRVHATINAAFHGHFAIEPVTYEEYLDDWVGSPLYDPELILIAQEGGDVVGAVTSIVVERGIGWVAELGVERSHRGRGIGTALLMTAFAALAAKGCAIARLNVDSSNPTGAPALYERAGMRVHRAWSIFQKELQGEA